MQIGSKVRKTMFTKGDQDVNRVGTVTQISEQYAAVQWTRTRTAILPIIMLEAVSD